MPFSVAVASPPPFSSGVCSPDAVRERLLPDRLGVFDLDLLLDFERAPSLCPVDRDRDLVLRERDERLRELRSDLLLEWERRRERERLQKSKFRVRMSKTSDIIQLQDPAINKQVSRLVVDRKFAVINVHSLCAKRNASTTYFHLSRPQNR